jgi:hypothetical protein
MEALIEAIDNSEYAKSQDSLGISDDSLGRQMRLC